MTPEDFDAAMDAMFARSMILERARLLRDAVGRDPQDVCDAELADTLEAENMKRERRQG